MSSVISTRTIFLNSTNHSAGDFRVLSINFPTQLLNYHSTSKLRLTLNTFSCSKMWYTLNKFNTIFYIADVANNIFHPCQIPVGNYTTFTQVENSLAPVITNILADKFGFTGTVTINFDELLDKFTVTLSAPVAYLKFVAFCVQGEFNAEEGSLLDAALGDIRANSMNGILPDVHTILGGSTNRKVSNLTTMVDLISLFDTNKDETIFTSKFPCCLQTNDSLYLRVASIPTNNIESTNLSKDYSGNTLISSDIIGKILLDSDLSKKYITYLDANNNFEIEIQANQFVTLRLALTDDKCRLVPVEKEEQATDGSISFSVSLKVEELSKNI